MQLANRFHHRADADFWPPKETNNPRARIQIGNGRLPFSHTLDAAAAASSQSIAASRNNRKASNLVTSAAGPGTSRNIMTDLKTAAMQKPAASLGRWLSHSTTRPCGPPTTKSTQHSTAFFPHFSTTLLFNTSPPHFSTILFSNTSPQHSYPTLLSSTPQHSFLALLYTTLLARPLPNTLFQHLSPTLLYNTLLQLYMLLPQSFSPTLSYTTFL